MLLKRKNKKKILLFLKKKTNEKKEMFKHWNEEVNVTMIRKTFIETLNTDWYNLFTFIVSILVIIITILLNLFILIIVIVDKSMRNYTNIQFASISLADLLVGALAMPFMLISYLYNYWPLNTDYWYIIILYRKASFLVPWYISRT